MVWTSKKSVGKSNCNCNWKRTHDNSKLNPTIAIQRRLPYRLYQTLTSIGSQMQVTCSCWKIPVPSMRLLLWLPVAIPTAFKIPPIFQWSLLQQPPLPLPHATKTAMVANATIDVYRPRPSHMFLFIDARTNRQTNDSKVMCRRITVNLAFRYL